ncbi:hypothetical protein EBZ37_15090, partial [bacterium]|nr:hypothetical protein [bacterium]
MPSLDEIVATLKACGQEHLLAQLPDLSEDHAVFKQLLKVDIAQSVRRFQRAIARESETSQLQSSEPLKPVDNAVIWRDLPPEQQEALSNLGWEALAAGKVAAVIMSGGQGTRLGYSGPKGCYNLGLPSQKSIFQLHVERILRVRILSAQWAAKAATTSGSSLPSPLPLPHIPIYIMTSDLNDGTIRAFFQEHDFFGYPPEDIFFFEQRLEPCFSLDGKVILESPSSGLSLAPDGNGGLYVALVESGGLADLKRRG